MTAYLVETNNSLPKQPITADVDSSVETFFGAIRQGVAPSVRQLLAADKSLCHAARRGDYRYPVDVEVDGYNLLGAYLNPLTGLHFSLLLGFDDIAADIIDASFKEDLEIPFGIGNTALHLATLVGSHRIVRLLLERGCNTLIKNKKGISPLDVVDDQEMRAIFDRDANSADPLKLATSEDAKSNSDGEMRVEERE